MNSIWKSFFTVIVLLMGGLVISLTAHAEDTFSQNGINIQRVFVYENGAVEIEAEARFYFSDYSDTEPDKAEFYRSDSKNGEYKLIGTENYLESYPYIRYTDTATTLGNTYYYKLRFLKIVNGQTVYGELTDPIQITCVPSPGEIRYVRATKAKTFTIKWNPVSNVDGYEIYIKEFPNKYLDMLHYYAVYEMDDIDLTHSYVPDYVRKLKYKKVAAISGASKSSFKYKKAKHGYGYLVRIRTFKNVNGKKVYSTISFDAHGVMDYYFCNNAENTKFEYKWPKKQKTANKMMKTIKVKVWDYKNHVKHSGKKITRTLYIKVNKKYADTIKQIYKEIYKSKKKPPIYEAGSYRWRKDEAAWSYHTVGTAIDMNCNENPMYSGRGKKRKIVVGSFYKPKKNPYSIPRNGVIEKTFAKYGFKRLDFDLMHFNAVQVYESSNY